MNRYYIIDLVINTIKSKAVIQLYRIFLKYFITGPFSTLPLQEAGFKCPDLSFALRNPLKIAECAKQVSQEGNYNLRLDKGILRRPIEIQRESINIVDGQLVKLDNPESSFEEVFEAALLEIPHGSHALIFVDDTDMPGSARKAIEKSFSNRSLHIY